jgi:hypothetical protein
MCSERRLSFPKLALCVGLACVTCTGCSGQQSSDQALNNAIGGAGLSKDAISPLAGQVTVDGRPPELARGQRLIVMLNDPQKLDTPSMAKTYVETSSQGEFVFTTYKKGDGVKPGKYILTFAILKKAGKRGMEGPDQLKNLYNDPEKNDKIPEFVIDHKAPGKSDYSFNLQVAGKEAATPGPNALTDLLDKAIGRQ